jgi:hypothetical protein
MKLTILAIDALSPQLASKYPWLSTRLISHRPIEVPVIRFIEDPTTSVVWASFLTGLLPEEHGILYPGSWGVSMVDWLYWRIPYAVRSPAHKFLDRFLSMRLNIRDNTFSSTWLHRLGFSFIDFPHINSRKYFDEEHRFQQKYLTTDIDLHEINEWLIKDFERKTSYVLQDENVVVYYRHIDALGHLLADAEVKRWCMEFANLVQVVSEKKDVLVVSDHGIRDGKHTNKGYCAATFPLDGIKSITDFAGVLPKRIGKND